MPILLVRIDDRLLHGQVVHGWGGALKPTLFAIVSDSLRADSGHGELYLLAVPPGARGRILGVAEAAGPAAREELDRERALVLLPGTDEAWRLWRAGFPMEEINLGGLHHRPGASPVLPYVYLDDEDRARIRELLEHGVRVTAQDLPSSPAHSTLPLLGRAP